MTFAQLADYADAIATIADWYFRQWGHAMEGETPERCEARLRQYLNRDKLPFMLLGLVDDEIAAAVQVKFREMDIYPDKEHWIGGVFVADRYRGRGFGTAIVERAVALARHCGVKTLHLQTESLDGGLYARLDWLPVEQVTYHGVEVLVMARDL